VLLLFTAAIVSNIESVQQTLNIALDAAYVHVFIPVEALIWIRSIAIVLLIVGHALRHVQLEPEQPATTTDSAPQPTPLVPTPELVDALRAVLAQITVSEKPLQLQALPSPQGEQQENKDIQRANIAQEAIGEGDNEPAAPNYERVKAYLAVHPDAKVREVAEVLEISVSTANKWMIRVRGECLQSKWWNDALSIFEESRDRRSTLSSPTAGRPLRTASINKK
jgi:hypothetical protein